jgi:hypothetical protein
VLRINVRWQEIRVDCDMKLKEVNRHHTYSKNKNIWGSEEIPLRDKERKKKLGLRRCHCEGSPAPTSSTQAGYPSLDEGGYTWTAERCGCGVG